MDARILVVEDDLTVAEVVVDYLRHAGLDPRHAVDGHIALEMAAAWRPDMVVLDLMLPGLSGLEVCRRLREGQDARVPLPVIMLTALGEESDRVLDLTVREFDLLAFLVSHPGRAFTRAELLEQVWGWSVGDLSTITVYVRRLRDKVEPEPAAPARLQTVWGVGYRWEAGIAEAHHGSVRVMNTADGCRFEIRLPACP